MAQLDSPTRGHRIDIGNAEVIEPIEGLDGDKATGPVITAQERQDGKFITGAAAIGEAQFVDADDADMAGMDVPITIMPVDTVSFVINQLVKVLSAEILPAEFGDTRPDQSEVYPEWVRLNVAEENEGEDGLDGGRIDVGSPGWQSIATACLPVDQKRAGR